MYSGIGEGSALHRGEQTDWARPCSCEMLYPLPCEFPLQACPLARCEMPMLCEILVARMLFMLLPRPSWAVSFAHRGSVGCQPAIRRHE